MKCWISFKQPNNQISRNATQRSLPYFVDSSGEKCCCFIEIYDVVLILVHADFAKIHKFADCANVSNKISSQLCFRGKEAEECRNCCWGAFTQTVPAKHANTLWHMASDEILDALATLKRNVPAETGVITTQLALRTQRRQQRDNEVRISLAQESAFASEACRWSAQRLKCHAKLNLFERNAEPNRAIQSRRSFLYCE